MRVKDVFWATARRWALEYWSFLVLPAPVVSALNFVLFERSIVPFVDDSLFPFLLLFFASLLIGPPAAGRLHNVGSLSLALLASHACPKVPTPFWPTHRVLTWYSTTCRTRSKNKVSYESAQQIMSVPLPLRVHALFRWGSTSHVPEVPLFFCPLGFLSPPSPFLPPPPTALSFFLSGRLTRNGQSTRGTGGEHLAKKKQHVVTGASLSFIRYLFLRSSLLPSPCFRLTAPTPLPRDQNVLPGVVYVAASVVRLPAAPVALFSSRVCVQTLSRAAAPFSFVEQKMEDGSSDGSLLLSFLLAAFLSTLSPPKSLPSLFVKTWQAATVIGLPE